MHRIWNWLGLNGSTSANVSEKGRTKRLRRERNSRRAKYGARRSRFESLERREVFTADPLPVLLVIADTHHFYYQEYGDTRASLEAANVDVVVAARTTATSTPHPGTGEPWTGGAVTPDIALADVDVNNYSAIAFVGGWGSSMYQYAFPGDYDYDHYDGDLATKAVVNQLIGQFLAADKYVAGVCHGTMVLAWARVDGVSPLAGKTVSIPWIGSPAVEYGGVDYANFALMQYDQAIANGALPNASSGIYGADPVSEHDDVVVDGRIITAENQNTAAAFGAKIAELVVAEATPTPPPNSAPTIDAAIFVIEENSASGTIAGNVVAMDADAGQTLSYGIIGGNELGGFAIDPTTGQITVADMDVLDYETTPEFQLVVEVIDSGSPALSSTAVVTIQLTDVAESASSPIRLDAAGNLVVQGTDSADTIYLWTSAAGEAFAWLNGQQSGPFVLGAHNRIIVHAGGGNDHVFATDSRVSVTIYGGSGHDLITGGSGDDILYGDDGVDRIWGGAGNDLIFGGAGADHLDGREGNDVLVGGEGNDILSGQLGRDLLIGGAGSDLQDGGQDDDLLIGGTTSYDNNEAALLAILYEWMKPTAMANRIGNLQAGLVTGESLELGATVEDDGEIDYLNGSAGADWFFSSPLDKLYGLWAFDHVTS